MTYSQERKRTALTKLLPPHNRSVADVAKEEGIPHGTLYHWRNELKLQGEPVPNNKDNTKNWSPKAKFAVVVETAHMNEAELSQYCREKGLYPNQIHQWREASINGVATDVVDKKSHQSKLKSSKEEIKSLRKELRYKEKALAETAALLALQKKLHALWEIEDEGV